MNTESVIQFANTIFDKVDQIDDHTYKAELTFGKESTAGIFYIDINTNFSKIDFKKYQKELLGKEYFQNRGSIQWNYYLLLLQDKLDEKKKIEIESDDQFARKYVFNEIEFIDFFTIEKSKGTVEQNVTNEWKNRLDKIGFSEVYSKVPMTQAVQRFLKNEQVEPELPNFYEGSEQMKISSIDKITLTNDYREYPKTKREFNFGRANLVYGINGVGKTSLFESLELILCGKTFQNPDSNEKSGAIGAWFNKGKDQYSFNPEDSNLYKSRDMFWYANTKSRANSLAEAFNRYNYFNSDAAYTFANSNEEETITNALYNLVLGPEYNYLKERVDRILNNNLKSEFNRLKKDITEQEKVVVNAGKELAKIKLTENIKLIESSIVDSITEIKIKRKFDPLEKNYVDLELEINEIVSILESMDEDDLSLDELNSKLKDLKSFEERLQALSKQIEEIQESRRLSETKQKELADLEVFFETAQKYVSNPKLFKVEKLSEKRRALDRSIQQRKLVLTKIDNVSFDELKKNKNSIEKEIEILNEHRKEVKNKLTEINKKITLLIEKFGELEKLTAQIIELGGNYIEKNKEAEECPLCHTEYTYQELSERILNPMVSDIKEDSKELKELYSKQTEEQKKSDKITKKIELIQLLKECSSKLDISDDQIEKESIKAIVDLLDSKLEQLSKLEGQRREYEELKDLLVLNNASEQELSEITKRWSLLFENELFGEEIKSEFLKRRKENDELVESNKKKIESYSNSIEKLRERFITKEKLQVEDKFEIKSFSKNKDIKKLEEMKDLWNDLSKSIEIDSKLKSKSYLRSLGSILKKVEQYKGEVKSRDLNKFWNDQKKKAEKFVSDNKDQMERMNIGVKELEKIYNEMNSNEHLKGFFESNLSEIFDIFKTIHTPKEFTEIFFSNGNVVLKDIKDESRTISEISTGQRSALALSIFLCLNRKLKNGPNILLFDDPVSFIDDFNALSFLDFLRYFVLKENKQLFFATANIKLANLFRKKFSFLDDEFAHWQLTRESITT